MFENNITSQMPYEWRGKGGQEPGRIRAGGGREAGGGGPRCGSHARAGGRKRMKDIKFLSKLSKIRTKEYSLFTILTIIKLYRQS